MIFTTGMALRSPSSETTTSPTQTTTGSTKVFDDNSCSKSGPYTHLCCYHNLRYDCSYLNDQFRAGYCRPNADDFSDDAWKKCDIGIPNLTLHLPDPTKSTTGSSLPYAADLTSCAKTGTNAAAKYARDRGKRSGAGYCAVGTRHALMCMFKKRGNPKNIHCGGSAYDYYGKNCLESLGFKNDMSACDRPGVVRVYYGYKHKNPAYSGGDRHGHIEFLGTDGQWHAGVSSSLPIDDNRKAGNRRKLKACYVLKSGSAQ